MSSPEIAHHLLTKQQEQLELLLSLLRQEYTALSARNIETLEALLPEKQQSIDSIAALDQELSGLPDLETQKLQPWFSSKVNELQALLASCQYQTQINEKTVEQSQLVVQRLKTELLQGQGRAGLTYTAKGKPAIADKGPGIKA